MIICFTLVGLVGLAILAALAMLCLLADTFKYLCGDGSIPCSVHNVKPCWCSDVSLPFLPSREVSFIESKEITAVGSSFHGR